MSWQGIVGHDRVVEQFRRRVASGRLASTYLFLGPAGIGKRTFAMKFAQTLLCQQVPPENMDPCGVCADCRQVLAESHPDLVQVSKPADSTTIPLDDLIGRREYRGKEGFYYDMHLKPNRGSRKLGLIHDADYFHASGANSMLKLLEEPPPRAVIILLGTSLQRQLPTIRSRSQLVFFEPLGMEECADLLLEQGLADTSAAARELAALSSGSLELARELSSTDVTEFRRHFLARLAETQWDPVALAKAVGNFVDEAGKEAPLRRGRLRQVMRFAIELYRGVMLATAAAPARGDSVLEQAVQQALTQPIDLNVTTARLARTIEVIQQVDSNANQATVIECWLDDLSEGSPYLEFVGAE